MKKIMALVLALVLALSMVACGGGNDKPNEAQKTEDGKQIIKIWAVNEEVPNMAKEYAARHPEFAEKYELKCTVMSSDNFETTLDQALATNSKDAPDIWTGEAASVKRYIQNYPEYLASYEELGIEDVTGKIAAGEIAPYTVEIGTRPSDEKVVALAFQSTGGAMIYRRSIAKDVFGTDDPAKIGEIVGAGTGNFDKFFEAAETLKQKGYVAVSGYEDIYYAVAGGSDYGWVVDGELKIDPKREATMDMAKMMKDKGYHNDAAHWTDAWFADMRGEGAQPCFSFFGPAWLINFTITPNCGGEAVGEGSYGDWAVCPSPVGFSWGGTYLMTNAKSGVKEGVAELIEWITLDTSEDGLQYAWANGLISNKDTVASSKVMAASDGTNEMLGGQNMFEVFVPANASAKGDVLTPYDYSIEVFWHDQVAQYASGNKSREQAIKDFKQQVADNIDVTVNFD